MHIIAAKSGAHDDAEPIDLGQTPGDMVVLSAADSELALLSSAYAGLDKEGVDDLPSLRLANFLQLKHNYSVDLYAEKVLQHAKVVVVRLLGGKSYWRYGVETLTGLAARHGVAVVFLPGDDKPDPALMAASTVASPIVERLWSFLCEGGTANASAFLRLASELAQPRADARTQEILERHTPALPMPRCGLYWPGADSVDLDLLRRRWSARAVPIAAPIIPILFYRALAQAGDLGGVDGLIDALIKIGIAPLPIFLPSLKDAAARDFLSDLLANVDPPVIITTTAFAISDPGAAQSSTQAKSPLPGAPDAVMLQVPLSSQQLETWQQSAAGLGPRDVAMHVSLPEIDGRLLGPAASFKSDTSFDALTQLRKIAGTAVADRVDRVAHLAAGWASLRAKPNADKRAAIVMANYPNRDARIGNGVGLDTPASVCTIIRTLAGAGFAVGNAKSLTSAELIATLQAGATNAGVRQAADEIIRPQFALKDYAQLFATLPCAIQSQITQRWGPPHDDPMVAERAFQLPAIQLGNIVIAIQPARGYNIDPKETYHDPALVPPHSYLAFYLWLRKTFRADAVIHAGKHGNLEWLPGKALALSQDCFPDAVLGGLPNIYPFIVNDPGEGSQAKRRTAAVIVDHLTPPLTRAESHGALAELEILTDEYYQAQPVDARRADQLAREILNVGDRDGLLADLGITLPRPTDPRAVADALTTLDAHLCDLKELQIRDGLHIFGQSPDGAQRRDLAIALARVPRPLRPGTQLTDDEWAQSSLLRALAVDFGISEQAGLFDPLDCDFAAPWDGPKPGELQAVSGSAWRSVGDTIERLELFSVSVADDPDAVPEHCAHTRDFIASTLTEHQARIDGCGPSELCGLLRALDGKFLAPGPAGAPTRGRADVLPTGRNFFSLDSRTLPTPTAWDLGRRSAEMVVQRFLQDEGDWPRAIAMSAWGTANMRTGGDDIAQALALMGVQPTWEPASGRVTGYEIIPLGKLGRPRVDVTFRVSGFFRDAFPAQMALIDTAARAVAALDEPLEENPIAVRWREDHGALIAEGTEPDVAELLAGARVFGSKPGAYGAGLQALVDEGIWEARGDLANAYVTWGQYIYSGRHEGRAAEETFRRRLAATEAIVHNQDNREHDLLDSDDYYQFEGGLAASVAVARGTDVPVFHNDHSRPERPVVRALQEEIGRIVRGRAANPKWLAGVMRHGYKGAFEINATVDYLFAFAATTTAVKDHHFDALYDAYIEADEVREFLGKANPDALRDLCKRFLEAQDRELWTPKRNSARTTLEALTTNGREK